VNVGRRVSALAAAALLVAGCSSGGKKSSGTIPSTGPARPLLNACAVVPASDATAMFGRPAKTTTVNHPTGAVSVCAWTADSLADPNDPRDITYKIETYAYQGLQYYGVHDFAAPTRLQGVGDRAYIVTAPNILQGQVEKNGNVISISYSVTAPFVRPSPKASAQLAQFTALLRAAAARM
jgi:hypothetical protein